MKIVYLLLPLLFEICVFSSLKYNLIIITTEIQIYFNNQSDYFMKTETARYTQTKKQSD